MKKALLHVLCLLAVPSVWGQATYSVTPASTSYSGGGGQVLVQVTLSYPANAIPSIAAKPPAETWAYVGAVGDNVPTVAPRPTDTTIPGDPTSSFGFTYSEPPASGASFSFLVSYPAGLSGDQTITFSGDYRLDGVRTPVTIPPVALSLASSGALASPTITSSPAHATKVQGATVSFAVGALGNPAPSYQWKKNDVDLSDGANVSGATTSILTLTNVQIADGGNYTVRVYNTQGEITSQLANLTVVVPPVITTQPQSQTVTVGASANFVAVVTSFGPTPTYQWKKGGTPIPNATNAVYSITSAQTGDAGNYTVDVTNLAGTTTSNVATLTVNAAPVPVISVQPISQIVLTGSAATFTLAATNPGTGTLTYRWYFTPSGSQTPQAMTDQSGKFAGTATASLAVSNVQSSDVGDYTCVVSNPEGSTTSHAAALGIAARLVKMVSQTAAPGSTVVVPVQLLASGSENALGFSVSFDPAQLAFVSMAVGAQAADASLVPNSSQAASGKIGLLVSKPFGATWTAGTQEVIKLTFTVGSSLANGAICALTFGDTPVTREISDAAASALPGGYQDGTVTVFSGYEADMNGNGVVTTTDWVKVGRIVAGLDPMPTGVDFLKADCAPRSTLGNGAISTTDWVQAGRYAAGLDPLTPVGGPGAP